MCASTGSGQMNSLFENAILSIQLGVEDYKANDPKRSLSAVRNFYAGMLLLAKEVLARRVPRANPDDIIGAQYKPVPDGVGGVEFKPKGKRTIDFTELGERFRDFGVKVDYAALNDLNQIRNEIEHRYTRLGDEKVREALGKAFPVAVDLFRAINEDPQALLVDSWQTMLDVRSVYEKELAACRSTFVGVNWISGEMAQAALCCPRCESHLVARLDVTKQEQCYADARCRACGEKCSAEELVESTLKKHFEVESHVAAKDGDISPLGTCPECSLETYVQWNEENQCAGCGLVLETCGRCETELTPDNVSWDDYQYCSYCDHIMSKDD
jgi:hypothetical protein